MIIICTNGSPSDILSLGICLNGIETNCPNEDVLIFTNNPQFKYDGYKVILTEFIKCNCKGAEIYGPNVASSMLIRLAAFDYCKANNIADVLYLDTDAIVVGDISLLLKMNSHAVLNGPGSPKGYFNSGVIKLNLNEYNFSFVEQYKLNENSNWVYPDQDFLNEYITPATTTDKSFNWYESKITPTDAPSIIHFISNKPWLTHNSFSSIEKTKRILHLVTNQTAIDNISKFFYTVRIGR